MIAFKQSDIFESSYAKDANHNTYVYECIWIQEYMNNDKVKPQQVNKAENMI